MQSSLLHLTFTHTNLKTHHADQLAQLSLVYAPLALGSLQPRPQTFFFCTGSRFCSAHSLTALQHSSSSDMSPLRRNLKDTEPRSRPVTLHPVNPTLICHYAPSHSPLFVLLQVILRLLRAPAVHLHPCRHAQALLLPPVHSSASHIRTGTTLSCWCTRCWHGSQLYVFVFVFCFIRQPA